MDGIADEYRAEGMSQKQALISAGEEGWRLLIGQMEYASRESETTFKEMASALIKGDARLNGGRRQVLLERVLSSRELHDSLEFGTKDLALPGRAENSEFTLDESFGLLAGVQVNTLLTPGPESSSEGIRSETLKGLRTMSERDEILFVSEREPDLPEMFKPGGGHYKAYVRTEKNGDRFFHRVPLAVFSST